MGFEDSMYDDGYSNPQDYFEHLCKESYKDDWQDYDNNENDDEVEDEYDEDDD